ncbi:MAG: hypothetical protein ACTTHG_01270 [Treponemataceae bacterium]
MKNIRYSVLIPLFFAFILLPAFSQMQLSVQVNDNVYQLLENAHLRGIIPVLPANKPYTREFTVAKLNEILDSGKLKPEEIETYLMARERINPKEAQPWYITGYYTNRFEEKNKDFPITAGIRWESNANLNCNSPYLSNQHWLELYIEGGIKEHFSYKINGSGGVIFLKKDSFAPNSFTKSWDGFQYIFSDFYLYVPIYEGKSAGAVMEPEICFSSRENKFGIKFSRTRHQWGYADGSLFLSNTARPFLAIETWFNPVKWFQTDFTVGTLEYVSNGDLKNSAWAFQTMFSSVQGQFNIGKYFYFGALGTLTWAKRLELGYMYPLLFPFLYQNQIGDFDNMQIGLYFGVNIPKIAHIYGQVFIDECNVTTRPFFNHSRNMVANMIGAKSPLPFWTSTLTFQYTKIEPFMYTHPDTEVPWYGKKINTDYVNHGECLGYNLGPNSDEFRLHFRGNPVWYITTDFSYTLVRHGATHGWGKVIGSSLSDKMDYYLLNMELHAGMKPGDTYWKDFLHDGVYEWINSVSLGATLNCRKWKIPIDICASYTFSYTNYSFGNVHNRKNFFFFEDDTYKNKVGNYLTLAVKVYN